MRAKLSFKQDHQTAKENWLTIKSNQAAWVSVTLNIDWKQRSFRYIAKIHIFFFVSGQDQKFNGKPQPGIYETHSNFLVTPLTAWLKREYLSHVKLALHFIASRIRYSDFALKYVDEKEIVKKN